MRALFHCQLLVMHIAFDMGTRLQDDFHSSDRATNRSADCDAFAGNDSRHVALLADDDFAPDHIAFDASVNL